MIRAGVKAAEGWNPDVEEAEALVASVFLTMLDEAPAAKKPQSE
jgi:hypothetical protein